MNALGFLTEVGKAEEFTLLSDVLGLSVFVDDRSPSDRRRDDREQRTGPVLPARRAAPRGALSIGGRRRTGGEPLLFTGPCQPSRDGRFARWGDARGLAGRRRRPV